MPSSTKTHWFFTGLVALWSLVYLFFGETIPINDGFAYDGGHYGTIAQDFFNQVFVIKQTSYITQRVLPSGLVYLALKLFHITPDPPAVVAGFRILNMLCLCGATYLFGRILLLFNLRFEHQCLAFVGLLFNFALLKSHYYNPVVTDIVAFFLGMVIAYCYLARKQWLLLTTLVLGFFVWPNMIYGGLVLFAFPAKTNSVTSSAAFGWEKMRAGLLAPGSLLAATLALLAGITALSDYYELNPSKDGEYNSVKAVRWLFLPSALALLGYIYLSFDSILRFLPSVKNMLQEISSVAMRIVTGIVLFFALHELIGFISTPYTPFGVDSFISGIIFSATTRPFINVISHVVYFGPIIILAGAAWRSVGAAVSQYGLGLQLFFCFHLLLGISPETRIIINLLPFLTLFTVLSFRDIPISRFALVGFTLIAFCLSKVWWIFNIPASADHSMVLEFPYQKLFMNYGPWMNQDMYMIHGLVIAACTVYLFNAFQFSRIRQG